MAQLQSLLTKSFQTEGKSFSRLVSRLAVAGVALGIAVMLITISVVSGYQKQIPLLMKALTGDVQVLQITVSNDYESEPLVLSPKAKQTILQNQNVEQLWPFVTKAGIAKTETDFEGILLQGLDSTYPASKLKGQLASGKIPSFAEGSDECLIPQRLAERMHLKAGDKLPVYFIQQPPRVRAFKITGIYKSPLEGETGRPMLLVPMSHLQKINNWGADTVGGYQISLKPTSQPLETVTEDIHTRLPEGCQALSVRELFPNLFLWLSLFDTNERIILSIMLAVAGLNMISAFILLVLEKRKEIGLLKALGMTNKSIFAVFLRISAKLILKGLVLGNVVAVGLLLGQDTFHWVQLNEKMYYLSSVPVSLDLLPIIWVNVGTLVFCLIALFVPSRIISGISPVKAISF